MKSSHHSSFRLFPSGRLQSLRRSQSLPLWRRFEEKAFNCSPDLLQSSLKKLSKSLRWFPYLHRLSLSFSRRVTFRFWLDYVWPSHCCHWLRNWIYTPLGASSFVDLPTFLMYQEQISVLCVFYVAKTWNDINPWAYSNNNPSNWCLTMIIFSFLERLLYCFPVRQLSPEKEPFGKTSLIYNIQYLRGLQRYSTQQSFNGTEMVHSGPCRIELDKYNTISIQY